MQERKDFKWKWFSPWNQQVLNIKGKNKKNITTSQHQWREACESNERKILDSIGYYGRHHSCESHDLLHFNLIGLHSGFISQWATRETSVGRIISSHMTRSITTWIRAVWWIFSFGLWTYWFYVLIISGTK